MTESIDHALRVARERMINEMRGKTTGAVAVTIEAHMGQGGVSNVRVTAAISTNHRVKRAPS